MSSLIDDNMMIYYITSSFAAIGVWGFKKIVSLNSFPDQGEGSNKISAQSVQLFGLKRVIVTLAVYPRIF